MCMVFWLYLRVCGGVLSAFGCVQAVFCGDVGILDDLSVFCVCLDEFCGYFGVFWMF